jgi:hypothetical protein
VMLSASSTDYTDMEDMARLFLVATPMLVYMVQWSTLRISTSICLSTSSQGRSLFPEQTNKYHCTNNINIY